MKPFRERHPPCAHCGGWHACQCPRIKAIEYYPDGSIKRVEYHEPTIPPSCGMESGATWQVMTAAAAVEKRQS